ncbi:MAG: hypothetical protein Q4B42_06840 [Oscillospiraceae bacterium]|nr:hypothetical protein [Oscillospiraceae bacterium]
MVAAARGLDHCYALRGFDGRSLFKAASVRCPENGAQLDCFTTAPGLQLYTANWLEGTPRLKDGKTALNHRAFCLEAQSFPASPNFLAFPNTILRPGETWRRKTVYKLRVE